MAQGNEELDAFGRPIKPESRALDAFGRPVSDDRVADEPLTAAMSAGDTQVDEPHAGDTVHIDLPVAAEDAPPVAPPPMASPEPAPPSASATPLAPPPPENLGFGASRPGGGPAQQPAPPTQASAPPPKSGRKLPLKPMLIGGAVLVFGGIGLIQSIGNTDAADLKVGSCFVLPDTDESFDKVEDQDCAVAHEAEIVGTISGLSGDDAYESCIDLLTTLPAFESYGLPEDADLTIFIEDGVQTDTLCVLFSESGGLVGSVMSGAKS